MAGGEFGDDIIRPGGLHEPNVAAGFEQVGLAERVAENSDVARCGPQVAGEYSGKGGFAAAIGAENGGADALGDLPGDAAEDLRVASGEGEGLQVDGGVGGQVFRPWEKMA